jgi:hypothetical protein
MPTQCLICKPWTRLEQLFCYIQSAWATTHQWHSIFQSSEALPISFPWTGRSWHPRTPYRGSSSCRLWDDKEVRINISYSRKGGELNLVGWWAFVTAKLKLLSSIIICMAILYNNIMPNHQFYERETGGGGGGGEREQSTHKICYVSTYL